MPRTIVIGATGHIGTYLVPRLVEAGHDVVAIGRGRAKPYLPHAAWDHAETQVIDRDAAEKEGGFGKAIAALKPDIVIDNICFTIESARHLVSALQGKISHFIHVGTIWTHGIAAAVPTREDAPKHPFGGYGIQKKLIEDFLLAEARQKGFPATLVHPGHIVGRGWTPLNPAGHFNNEAFAIIRKGEKLMLPNFGLETVHHVHADDIAALMMAAISSWSASHGESFHAVSEQALTLRGYAEAMYRWFGHEPNIGFAPFGEWKKGVAEGDAQATLEHIARSPNCSMEKAHHLLGFRPRYSSLAAVQESVDWLIGQGKIS